ncbi:MAG: conjugative relaxase [Burkholderiales bacterium]|nr:conjugative relaxase [Burkholderiales bacterium]
MLSIGVLHSPAQAGSYYAQDDYYTKDSAGEPSQWDGRGAESLGLAGLVDRVQFEALLNGELPNGVVLKRGQQGKHQPGWDLTFSAPKSVSLLALVGDDGRVTEAHNQAATEALRYLEATTARARIKQEGKNTIETTGNWIIARFNHDTSRELDPQLHTHAVVINATRRADGEWRALSTKEMFRAKMLGGVIYRAELARALQRLGYEVEIGHRDGRFEVKGFTKEQLRHFSRRREEIEAALEKVGASGAKASATLALYTRARKGPIDRAEVYGDWKTRARDQGVNLRELISQRAVPRAPPVAAPAREAVAWAIAHLSERESVISHRDVVRHALEYGTGKATLADVAAGIRDAKKTRVLLPVNDGRYTTTKAIVAESETLAAMRRGQGRVRPIASPEQSREAAREHGLAADQTDAATFILTTKERVIGVQGYAGTGKTHMLRAVREVAERAGYTVRGFAPSATAARVLQQDAGIPSDTVSRHLVEIAKESKPWQSAGELWVVDEASMMSTEQARALVSATDRQKARLVLVGDRQQLPAIEAGRPFAMLLERGMASVEMREIKRQKSPILKAAVLDSIGRREAAALKKLAGHTHAIADRDARLDAIVKDYLAPPAAERNQTLIVTGVNEDRREINERIRARLKKEKALDGPEASGTVLVQRDLTRAELTQAKAYQPGNIVRFGRAYAKLGIQPGEYLTVSEVDIKRGVVSLLRGGKPIAWEPRRAAKVEVYQEENRSVTAGDRLRWTRNDRELGRRNGEVIEVISVDAAKGVATVRGSRNAEPLDLSTKQHWEHAYASTVHAAQGKTADRVLVHLDTGYEKTIGSESFYVAISRARHDARLYVDDRSRLTLAIGRSRQEQYALEALESTRLVTSSQNVERDIPDSSPHQSR